MRCARNVARAENRNAYRISVKSYKERDHKEDLEEGERIILKAILER
jgi:hypothetical protein